MAIHYSLAAIVLTGSMASTGITATTWIRPHIPVPVHRMVFLGEAGSRLVTTSMPHFQPMDTEARLTSIDFNLRRAGKNGDRPDHHAVFGQYPNHYRQTGQYHSYWDLSFPKISSSNSYFKIHSTCTLLLPPLRLSCNKARPSFFHNAPLRKKAIQSPPGNTSGREKRIARLSSI